MKNMCVNYGNESTTCGAEMISESSPSGGARKKKLTKF